MVEEKLRGNDRETPPNLTRVESNSDPWFDPNHRQT